MSKERNTGLATSATGTTVTRQLRPLNARSIALSVLLGTHPPELPARAFVAMADLFDVPAGTMRTALSRMVAAGDVVAADGHYRLAGRLLERQQAQDTGRRPPIMQWDGAWRTAIAVDDQRAVAARRRFRATMANHRYGELRPDIWMRPDNLDRPPPVDDSIVTAGPMDGIDPDRLTRRLWDLPTIAADGHRLLGEMAARRVVVDWDDADWIPDLFTVSAAVVRYLRNDPMLPGSLTPDDWPVDDLRHAYDRFEADHQRLLQRFLRDA